MKARIVAVLACLVLAGCAAPLADGAAPPLKRSEVCRAAGRNSEAGLSGDVVLTITIKADDGWCAISLQFIADLDRRPRGEPMVVATPPAHGEIDIVHMASTTRAAYRATPGYAGRDSFLLRGVQSNITRRVDVMVQP